MDKLYPAEYMVFWPGEEVMACKKHRDGLINVNRAMGGPLLSIRRLEDIGESGPCPNCVNEAKKNE